MSVTFLTNEDRTEIEAKIASNENSANEVSIANANNATEILHWEWEQGSLGASAGAEIGSTKTVRTVDFIVPTTAGITVNIPYNKYRMDLYIYELNGTYLGVEYAWRGIKYTLHHGRKYRLCMRSVYDDDGVDYTALLASVPTDVYGIQDYYPNIYKDNRAYTRKLVNDYTHIATDILPAQFESVESIYARYDALVSAYPEYVSRVDLGMDASNTYHIYRYHFKPNNVIVDDNFEEKAMVLPKILLFSGTHGGETLSIAALCQMFENICAATNVNSPEFRMRHCVEFVVIPVVNPWGQVNSTRHNANGVDLNRNYDYYWDISTVATKGSSAFSEVETQYVRDTILSNLDAIAAMDCHTNGSIEDEVEACKFWLTGSHSALSYRFDSIANTILNVMNQRAKESYEYTGEGFMGYYSKSSNLPSFQNWCSLIGMEATILEAPAKIKENASTESVRKAAYELLLNTVNMIRMVF